jgi:hypothetical protein
MAVLDSGMLVQGKQVAAFESEFATSVGVKHAIATSSGTTALHLALLAHGIGRGDEVITTGFTFVASANSILYVGGQARVGRHRSKDLQLGSGRDRVSSHITKPRHNPSPSIWAAVRHGRNRRHCSKARPGDHRGRSSGDRRNLRRPASGHLRHLMLFSLCESGTSRPVSASSRGVFAIDIPAQLDTNGRLRHHRRRAR